MQVQLERWNAGDNGNQCQPFWDHDGFIDSQEIDNNINNSPVISSAIGLPASCPSASSFSSFHGATYIEHFVSRFDTLAGVAIKYGVDVSDIKKMNGLVTDSQMFALKSIKIPLPGRHPPSPCLSNCSNSTGPSSSNQSPTRNINSDLFESFQSLRKPSQCKVSPAMSLLQGFYGLESTNRKIADEDNEMAIYSMGGCMSIENGAESRPSPNTYPSPSHRCKSRSLIGLFDDNDSSDILTLAEGRALESEMWCDKPIRRCRKSEADFTDLAPEKLMEEGKNVGGFPAITGSGLALRQKVGGKAASTCDQVNGISSPVFVSSNISTGLWDSLIDGLSRIRKSSSTSSLQDQDNASCASIWSTSRWSLTADLQALSTAAIRTPIFDGLPKPMASRRNKAALD